MRIVTAAIAFGIVSLLIPMNPVSALVPAPPPSAIEEAPSYRLSASMVPRVIYGYSHPTMQGWKRSTYRGKFYYKGQESWRKCIQFRESRHHYGAANSSSSARGAYQFLDSKWRTSLTHMIYPELRKTHGKVIADSLQKTLQKNPIHKWSREIQDMAFYTVLNYEGKWSGKKHWYLYNSNC